MIYSNNAECGEIFSLQSLFSTVQVAYHMAGLQYQDGVVAKPFRTLDLTITVAVYS